MNHVGWRYHPNPWRKFCGRWWKHWFDVRDLWWDLVDAFNRARRGWGCGDTWDLMSYHAGVTIGLLKHFREHHMGYIGDSPEEYNAKLDIAIAGWEAKYKPLTEEMWGDDET